MLITVHHLKQINEKNNFLVLDEGTTDDINGIIGAVEKTFSIKFSETKKKV